MARNKGNRYIRKELGAEKFEAAVNQLIDLRYGKWVDVEPSISVKR